MMDTKSNTMKVEIWSDVMCPFCYIGKRKFETALNSFDHRAEVEIEWKSFQLSPDMKTDPNTNINQFLSDHKGISIEQAQKMNSRVTEMAKQVGLVYDFEKSVVANSFNAHRFSHFAKQHGKQEEAEEKLFAAYFTEGKNIDDYTTLIALGIEMGLDADALKTALENKSFTAEVNADLEEARRLRVNGVPFFVFDRKYAVSGAQDSKVFAEVLEKSFGEWSDENSATG
ncbi:MAG: DsbA family oxidoreductase [Chitinophagales bacterium]